MLGRVELLGPPDALGLVALPDGPFTNRDVATAAGCDLRLAQRATYCLRLMDLLEPAGMRGRAPLFTVA